MRGHIAAEMVHKQVVECFPRVHMSTVYRTLQLLEELGYLRHAHFHAAGIRYQRTDETPHQYLLCLRCGNQREIDISILQPFAGSVRRDYGFEPDLTMPPSSESAVCASQARINVLSS